MASTAICSVLRRQVTAGLGSKMKLNPLWVRSMSSKSTTKPYWEAKKEAKQRRTDQFQRKKARLERIKTRRDESPKDVKKNEFRSWFDKKRFFQEMMDRKARQAGLDWTIRVATVVERLPMVIPDKPEWEREYLDLYTYLAQFGKEYPKELGMSEPEKILITDEEFLAMLPEGFEPAPRITEADKTGDVKTRDRRLATRVYLAVVPSGGSKKDLGFPTVTLSGDETLLEASKRAVTESVGSQMELYCPSHCPVAVDIEVEPEEKRASTGIFGTKTFFMRLQHDEGDVLTSKDVANPVSDFAWLDRSEMTERIKEVRGEHASKFYHYLL